VKQVLVPTLSPGDVVVLDNLPAHKSAVIQAAITARGARVEFLPSYSPDFNPIEEGWSKIKTILRTVKARTLDELLQALKLALASITERDTLAWFAHCGYPVHNLGPLSSLRCSTQEGILQHSPVLLSDIACRAE
jgi:transposase